jgi:hypothetical protein
VLLLGAFGLSAHFNRTVRTNLREKPIFFANAYDFLAKKLGNLNNF